jgi:hypothetical protein
VNQYLPSTSSVGWQLRIGSFKFDQCGTPDFYLAGDPTIQAICAGGDATYQINVGSVSGFDTPVTLSASGQPAGASASFSVNPVIPAGISDLTISNTGTAAAGSYVVNVSGTATGSPGHDVDLGLDVYDMVPGAPTPTLPADGALNQPLRPVFEWTSAIQAASFTLEVDDDPGFGSPDLVETGLTDTTFTPAFDLMSNTIYYWRVTGVNSCGVGASSAVYDFTTVALPGDCGLGTVPVIHYTEDFESGAPGWTHSGQGDTWSLSDVRVHGGTYSYHAVDVNTSTDQRLESPDVVLPTQSPVTLQFWNWQEMEDRSSGCWDGGILEISTDGGANWTYLPTDVMQSDPYDGPVTGLDGLEGWCGDPQDWVRSVVDLDAYAGQTARFRFRLGTDSSVGREGWYIDDVYVQSCEDPTPDFSLGVTPDSAMICAGDDAAFGIEVGSAGGFTNDVTLAASGQPAGSTVTFSVNPVTPPGNSGLIIGNTGGAAGGSYTVTVSGTADDSAGHDVDVTLDVVAGTPSAPTLVSPPDNAENQPFHPTFAWTEIPGAESYTLQVFEVLASTGPVIEETGILGTSHTPSVGLSGGRNYTWRVTAENICGTGASSAEFTFTTISTLPFADGFDSGDTSRWSTTGP